MAQPKRHEPHPHQAALFEALQALKPSISYAHIAQRFRARGLCASSPLISDLVNGETGATATELFAAFDTYGLDTAAEAVARLAGRSLAPKAKADGSALACGGRLIATAGSFISALAEALGDGRIDPHEAAALLPMVEGVEKLAAQLRTIVGEASAAPTRRQVRA